MRLAALAIGLGLAWVALEGALRIVGRGVPVGKPRAVGVHEPGRSPQDRPHMRSTPRPSRHAAPFRLLVIGDSFTWGDGVYPSDTYGKRLERMLERMDPDVNVRLSIYSRRGWNTTQELEAVEEDIRRLQPQLMILGYCLNDAEPRLQLGNDDIMDPLARRRPQGGLGRWLYRRSRLIRLLWERFENNRQRRAFDHYYHQLYERPGWADTRQALAGFEALARGRQVPLVVTIFPIFDQQLDAGYSYRDLHQRVMAELRERDIRALDLLPAYRGVDAVRLAVEPFTDPHPNELAHRIASQVLADYLIEQELVPVGPSREAEVGLSLRPLNEGPETR
jgi:lysophospholipase L1-like esterase